MSKSVSAPLHMSSQFLEPIPKPKYENYDFCKNSALEDKEKLKIQILNIDTEIKKIKKELGSLRAIFYYHFGREDDKSVENSFKEIKIRTKNLFIKMENLIEKRNSILIENHRIEKYIELLDKEINKLIPDAPPKKRRKIRNLPPTADERLQRIRFLNGIMALDEPGETINFSDSD